MQETQVLSWVRKIPWRRKWQPTPVPLPGTSHERRGLIGYSPWGRKKSDTTEQLHFLETFLSFCTFQPSQIKFSCLPVSRVECMLKLPSLDLVFSSNRGELETLGAAYPAETLSPGGSAPPSGTKTSSSKTGVPGVETFFYSISIKSQVLF